MQLKIHRNQWSKDESTQARTYKTCKINHSIQQLLQFSFKAFKPCKTLVLKKRLFKRNTFRFVGENDPSQQLPSFYLSLINILLLGTLGGFMNMDSLQQFPPSLHKLFFFFFFFFLNKENINNGTHELRMKTCSISPVIAIPHTLTPPHLFLAHPYIS